MAGNNTGKLDEQNQQNQFENCNLYVIFDH